MTLQVQFCESREAVLAFFEDGSCEIDADFAQDGSCELDADFGVLKVITDPKDVDRFNGPYSIVPKVVDQNFPTATKIMRSDLTVQEIPRHAVSNPSGGVTVTIGGD